MPPRFSETASVRGIDSLFESPNNRSLACLLGAPIKRGFHCSTAKGTRRACLSAFAVHTFVLVAGCALDTLIQGRHPAERQGTSRHVQFFKLFSTPTAFEWCHLSSFVQSEDIYNIIETLNFPPVAFLTILL
jgi:hypothetical protein